MSLINDALKRARETQRNGPPSGAPPLPPVESPARGGGWILAAAAILFLTAVCFFLGPDLFGHKAAPAATAKAQEISLRPPTAAAPAPSLVANALPSPAINTNPPPAIAATEALPRVQGIIFNSTRPLAIVNGQTVGVGDRAGDFQVKQILKTSVVFQRPDGSQKALGIGE